MSVTKEGFGKGFGLMFGVAAAGVVILVLLIGAGKVVQPCPTCHSSGNCVWCAGSGKGAIWGECLICNGKKSCGSCGGTGFKAR
jgi:hypothetical protein